MTKVIDITEQLFGKLTVINKKSKALQLCKCECEKETLVTSKSLRAGTTKSCGCIVNKHNMTDTPTWNSWRAMIRRCYKFNSTQYFKYGAKKIKVIERQHDFVNFLEKYIITLL